MSVSDKSTVAMLLSAEQAACLCGVSQRTWRAWHSGGLVPEPIRIGRSVFWRTAELHEWIESGCPKRRDWDMVRRANETFRNSAHDA